jgi:hypothetical protein
MDCSEIRPALSDLVDGSLAGDVRAGIDAHLQGCASCRNLFVDLKAIREAGRHLPKATPPEALANKVLDAIARERTPVTSSASPSRGGARILHGRFGTWSRPVWLTAAAAALVAVAVGVAVYVRMPQPTAAKAPANAAPTESVQSVESEIEAAQQHYTKAISALEQVAKEGQANLDPQTMAVFEKGNGLVDQAIHESQAAVKAQPSDEQAQASLFDALQRKVDLLKDAVALINEMRKGDQAGTARIVGGLGTK